MGSALNHPWAEGRYFEVTNIRSALKDNGGHQIGQELEEMVLENELCSPPLGIMLIQASANRADEIACRRVPTSSKPRSYPRLE